MDQALKKNIAFNKLATLEKEVAEKREALDILESALSTAQKEFRREERIYSALLKAATDTELAGPADDQT